MLFDEAFQPGLPYMFAVVTLDFLVGDLLGEIILAFGDDISCFKN